MLKRSVITWVRRTNGVREIPARGFWATCLIHLCLLLAPALFICAIALFALRTSDTSELLRRLVILNLQTSPTARVQLAQARLAPHGKLILEGLRFSDSAGSQLTKFSLRRLEVTYDPLKLFSAPEHPLSAVRQVVIEQPCAELRGATGGKWEVDNLFQHIVPETSHFDGEVIVRDGQLRFHDPLGGTPENGAKIKWLQHISGRVTQAGGHYMPFWCSGTVLSGEARAFTVTGGLAYDDRRLVCQFRVSDGNVPLVKRYLPRHLPFTLFSGRADARIQVVIEKDAITREWGTTETLLVDIHNVRGALRLGKSPIPFLMTQGQVRLASGVYELVDLRGSAGGVPVVVNGTVSVPPVAPASLQLPDAVLTLQVQVTRADARNVSAIIPGLDMPALQWGGVVAGWAQVTGTAEAPEVVAHFAGPSLAISAGTTVLRMSAMQGDLQYRGDSLDLSHLSLQGLGGRFTGDARLALGARNKAAGQTALLFQGRADGVQASEIAGLIRGDTGEQIYQGSLSGPIALTLAGDHTLSLIARAGGPCRVASLLQGDVDAGIRLDMGMHRPALLTVERMEMRAREGIFQLHGTLDGDRLACDVRGSQLDLGKIGDHFSRHDLGGAGYLLGKIDGTLGAPIFTGTVRAQNGRVSGQTFAELAGQVEETFAPSPVITVKDIRALSDDRRIELTAASLTAVPTGTDLMHDIWMVKEIKGASLSRGRLSAIMALLSPALKIDLARMNLDGFAEGTFDYAEQPTGGEERGTARLALLRPSARIGGVHLEFDTAVFHFTLLAGDAVRLDQAELRYEGMPGEESVITATGLWRDGILSLQASSLKMPVSNLTTLLTEGEHQSAQSWLPLGLDGTVDLRATITARLADPHGESSTMQALADSLVVKGEIVGGEDFTIAGLPYRKFESALEYHAAGKTLCCSRFLLSPADGTRDYAVALAAPCTVQCTPTTPIDLQLALRGAPTAPKGTPADLAALRKDLLAIAHNGQITARATGSGAGAHTPPGIDGALTAVSQYLRSIAEPCNGKATSVITLTGTLAKPLLAATVNARDLEVGGQQMPVIKTALSFDFSTRKLKIDDFTAKGGADPDANLSLSGTIILPVFDASGREITPGPISLHLDAQNIDPSLLGRWFPKSEWSNYQGELNITADTLNDATTSHPRIQASIDWYKPVIHGTAFDSIHAIVSLENDERDPTLQRLWIGQHQVAGGFATVQLNNADAPTARPLEVSGYLPFRWEGALKPVIPNDQPFELALRVPEQGWSAISPYLRKLSLPGKIQAEGTVAAQLVVGGTLRQPEFRDKSYLLAKSPLLTYTASSKEPPTRLRDLVLDLGLHAEHHGSEVENVIVVNDCSALLDRAAQSKARPSFFESLKRSLGLAKPAQLMTPSIALGGTIRLRTPAGGWGTPATVTRLAKDLSQQLRFDLYGRTVRMPLHLNNAFHGQVTCYLHMTTPDAADPTPRITGILAVEQ